MRLISVFVSTLSVLLLTSCAATTNNSVTNANDAATASKTSARNIKSLTFISGGPPLPAQMRRDQSLHIDSDLNAKMEVKNGYNTVLSEKAGKITQSQFDAITAKLNAANYIYLKPKSGVQAVPGSGKGTLIVSSDLGAHRFTNSGSNGFPEPIAEIFAMKDQLSPE